MLGNVPNADRGLPTLTNQNQTHMQLHPVKSVLLEADEALFLAGLPLWDTTFEVSKFDHERCRRMEGRGFVKVFHMRVDPQDTADTWFAGRTQAGQAAMIGAGSREEITRLQAIGKEAAAAGFRAGVEAAAALLDLRKAKLAKGPPPNQALVMISSEYLAETADLIRSLPCPGTAA